VNTEMFKLDIESKYDLILHTEVLISPATGLSTRQKSALQCHNGPRTGWYEERDCGCVNETAGSIKADDLSST